MKVVLEIKAEEAISEIITTIEMKIEYKPKPNK
jgi:hypothetical protein